jgi:hypothetical protein
LQPAVIFQLSARQPRKVILTFLGQPGNITWQISLLNMPHVLKIRNICSTAFTSEYAPLVKIWNIC